MKSSSPKTSPKPVYLTASSGVLTGAMKADESDSLYRAMRKCIAGKCLYSSSENGSECTQESFAEYSVELPVSGEWHLWGRFYYPGTAENADSNSFWVSIDGGEPQILGGRMDAYQQWHWDGNDGKPLALGCLEAGSHRLQVWNRHESGQEDLSPRLDLMMLTNNPEDKPNDHDALVTFGPTSPPYPPSRVISSIEWKPVSAMTRAGVGDNYPITWADDDNLYSCWGDGTGLEPEGRYLTIGFTRIEGGPKSFRGVSIRSNVELPDTLADGSHTWGRAGYKGCGMLMVGGILYLLVRNANRAGEQSHLLWSTNYAKTWTWADWRFEEFGYPTFVNFGMNYMGARDQYVYLVSPDTPSAYLAADHFVLLRVLQECIKERSSYEFFCGTDAQGQPRWSSDITARSPVFTYPGHCCRSGISYNAGLKRYLWWQQITKGAIRDFDTRYLGGFGVYEAPEPWGPWATVYFTHCWDTGPGECASFPPKWMSEDGRTVHLVASSNNTFSVRKAVLQIASEKELSNENHESQ